MPLGYYAYTTSTTSLTGVPRLLNSAGNMQSMSINVGREWLTDPYSPATCTFVARGAISNLEIGMTFAVIDRTLSTLGNYDCAFIGTIKDVSTKYGIVSNLDYTTIIAESYLARWGRRQFNSRVLTQAITTTQLNTLAAAIGFDTFTTAGGGQSIAAGQTYVGNGLDLVNLLVQTEVGHLSDAKGNINYTSAGPPASFTLAPAVRVAGRNTSTGNAVTFGDDSTLAAIRFDDIDFASAAQNYYTEATINPLALATQTAGSGNYNITQDSLDFSTGQALSHAQYLVSQFNTTVSTPLRITTSYSLQNNVNRQAAFQILVNTCGPGSNITLKFRNSTYYAIIEGMQISADPSDTTVELTLSSFDNNNYLILDDAIYGTLGTSSTYPGNKLGF